MIKNIQLQNYYKIEIKDAKVEKKAKRALLVDLEVSASGKVINNRIYPPRGHKSRIHTWIEPYKKPVLLHHNDQKDPVGRFVSAQWIDTETDALRFLGGNYNALNEIKKAFDSNDAQNIYKTLKKHGALDKKWPGLGKIIGKLRITDEDAIEKILDERYLTGSAGQGTDAYTCCSCGAEWHKGDMCDHSIGSTDEDGNVVVFLCGNMDGKEFSFVNHPANDTSVPISIEFEDSVKGTIRISMQDSLNDVPTIVPNFYSESEMNLKDLETLEIKTVLEVLADEANLTEFIDSLNGETQYEIQWLIKVHDALHSMYDFDLKYNGSENSRMPAAVYKLHASIHQTADAKSFRDSLMNGELDTFNAEGASSDEYVWKPATIDNIAAVATLAPFEFADEVIARLVSGVVAGMKEIEDGKAKEKEGEVEVLAADEDLPIDDTTIDWGILDMALDHLAGDAKLTVEKREALPASVFCGPDRSFPVHDTAHVEAARLLISKAKLSDDQKAKVIASVDRKAKKLGCGTDGKTCNCNKTCKSCDDLSVKHDELQKDYGQALQQIQQLRDQVETALKTVSKAVRPNVDVKDEKLDTLLDWATTIENTENNEPKKELKPVDDPGLAAKATKVTSDKELDPFTKHIVDTYQKHINDGEVAKASLYLHQMQRFLASSFRIENYVSSNKE